METTKKTKRAKQMVGKIEGEGGTIDAGNIAIEQSVSNLLPSPPPTAGFSNVMGVTELNMFAGATAFNQDIGGGDVTAMTNAQTMFGVADSALSTANYDALLIGWAAQAVQTGVTFGAGGSTYTSGGAAETARTTLDVTNTWTITNDSAAI